MKRLIPKKIFALLHAQIITKCKQKDGFEILGVGEALYGFGRFKDDKENPSIRFQMEQHPAIAKILLSRPNAVINGKYLYDRIRETQNGENYLIEISPFYEKIYMLFINYNSYDEFVSKLIKSGDISKNDLTVTKLEAASSSKVTQRNYHHYEGYYYSNKHREVNQINLKIDHSTKWAQFVRIHTANSATGSDPSIYEGPFEIIGANMRFELRNTINEKHKIYLILHNNYFRPRNLAFIKGVFMGLSSYDEPLSSEIIITTKDKQENEKWVEDEERKELAHQYLNLQKLSIFNPSPPIRKNIGLRPQGKPLNALQPLVGYYHAWSFSYYPEDAKPENFKFYKSKFVVMKDYRSYLVSAYGHDENTGKVKLPCILNPTEVTSVNYYTITGDRNVSITAKDEEGNVKSHAMVTIPKIPAISEEEYRKLPKKEKDKLFNSYKYIKGGFSSFGTKKRPFLSSVVIFERLGVEFNPNHLNWVGSQITQKEFDDLPVGPLRLDQIGGEKSEVFEILKTHYDNTNISSPYDEEKTKKSV